MTVGIKISLTPRQVYKSENNFSQPSGNMVLASLHFQGFVVVVTALDFSTFQLFPFSLLLAQCTATSYISNSTCISTEKQHFIVVCNAVLTLHSVLVYMK